MVLIFQVFANVPFYLGGTSLLIVVVVVMDFMSQVQSHLISNDSVVANLKNFGGSGLASIGLDEESCAGESILKNWNIVMHR